MSASSSQPKDQPTSSHKGADQKQLVVAPGNRWDSAVCFGGHYTAFEPDRLIVEMTDIPWGGGAVAAERPIPKKDSGIFYYEMTILKLEQDAVVRIGLSTFKPSRIILDPPFLNKQGRLDEFWGYASNGFIVYGNDPLEVEVFVESFDVGDVVGCGVDLATRQLICTKNGARLDTPDLFVSSAGDLFPTVVFHVPCLGRSNGKIEANFGPNFKYKFAVNK